MVCSPVALVATLKPVVLSKSPLPFLREPSRKLLRLVTTNVITARQLRLPRPILSTRRTTTRGRRTWTLRKARMASLKLSTASRPRPRADKAGTLIRSRDQSCHLSQHTSTSILLRLSKPLLERVPPGNSYNGRVSSWCSGWVGLRGPQRFRIGETWFIW